MRRRAEQDLKTWFQKRDRLPLIIRGARQVGKSTLVRLFAESYGLDLLEVNLEKLRLNSVVQDKFVLAEVLDEIQLRLKKRITEKTLIFFDEIQESPLLLKYLRYFYEERPTLAVVAAGSLLEIALRAETFSFPVGRVEFYHLGPMSFSEFLQATGHEFLVEKLAALEVSPAVAAEAKRLLNLYYYIGGMPKAILTYLEEESVVPVREVQEQILQAYVADFPKYNARIKSERIEKVFFQLAQHIGEKVIYSKLDSDRSSREIKRAFELLVDARVITRCAHSAGNSVPLAGEADQGLFKAYFLDIGLLNAMLRLDLAAIDQEMQNNFNTKGKLAEQFVAQHLAYLGNERRGPELYYWLRDKGVQKGEIDFLIQTGAQVIPVEVKARGLGHMKSLFYFCAEKKKHSAVKVSLDGYSQVTGTHKINGSLVEVQVTCVPQYCIEWVYHALKRHDT